MKRPRFFLAFLTSIIFASIGCNKLALKEDPDTSVPKAACSSQKESKEALALVEDDITQYRAGVLYVGDGMVDQLELELSQANSLQVASTIATFARDEMAAAVGTILISTGENVDPASIVAGPIVRGALLGINDPCSAAYSLNSGSGLVGQIVAGTTGALNGRTTASSNDQIAAIIGTITNEAVRTLPKIDFAGAQADASLRGITRAVVLALPRAGISENAATSSLAKIAEGATGALKTEGFPSEDFLDLSTAVVGSTVESLKDGGYSPDKIISSGAIGLILSGSMTGIKQGTTNAEDLVAAIAAISGGAVSALGAAGIDQPELKKSALAAVVVASVEESKLVADGASELMANALGALATQVVSSLVEGGFDASEIGAAISVVVTTGVSQLAKAGFSDASAITSMSSKIISGALSGTGQLLNAGSISNNQAVASAQSANTGALSGLSSLEKAGLITGDSVGVFKGQISSSITTGLQNSGVSADIVAKVEKQAAEVEKNAAEAPLVSEISLSTVASPTFETANDAAYTEPVSVTLASATNGASIRYTTDGSTPSAIAGTLYTGAFVLRASKTVKAIAYKDGANPSTVVSRNYSVNLPLFSTGLTFSTGIDPNGVSIADLDGDGKKDLAVSLYFGKGVSILRGNGDGTFNAKQDIPNATLDRNGNSTGNNFWSGMIAAGDLDNDGKADLTWGAWGFNGLSIALNATPTNTTSFVVKDNVIWVDDTGVSGPRGVAIGDADMDGDLDIFVGENNSGWRVVLYKNDGAGAFTLHSPQFSIGNGTFFDNNNLSPWMVALGDFNSDGKPDVAAGGEYGGYFSILINQTTVSGEPIFNSTYPNTSVFNTAVSPGCNNHRYISVSDVNGDAKVDVVATCTTNSIAIFSNTTTANQTSPSFAITTLAAPSGVSALTTGDVDNDGKKDIVAAYGFDVQFYKGNGDGTFAAPLSFAIEKYLHYRSVITLSDVNGDSRLDVVLTTTDDKVIVLLNQLN